MYQGEQLGKPKWERKLWVPVTGAASGEILLLLP